MYLERGLLGLRGEDRAGLKDRPLGEFPMSLDSDVIVDRRRIRRKLTFWRVTAALVAIAAIRRRWRACDPGRP
jgi:hypothetical protein